MLITFFAANQRLAISVENLTSMLHSVINSKLSSYMHQQEIEVLVRQLAEIFVITGGQIDALTVGYLKGVEVQHTSVLHTGV